MALNSMGLGFLFTAKNLASGKVRGLSRDFTQLEGTTQKVSTGFANHVRTMGAGLGMLAAGGVALAAQFKLASYAGQFEQGMAGVGAVSKATAEEMKMLEDAAINAGIATQFSPKEAVAGLTSLATAGQNAQQATSTLIPVLDLAAGSLGQLGVAEAAEAVVGTLNSYGIAAEKATGVTDKLLRITQLTNFQTKDFSVGLAKAAAAGATFGQSLDDTLIIVGQLRNANIDASSAATAYRESTRRLAADQNAQAAVTKLGVDIYDKQTGKIRPLINVMQDLDKAMGDTTDKERNATVARAFGARGLLAFNAVLKATASTTINGEKVTLKGAAAIEHLRKEMGHAGGTAAEFREKLLDTFEGQKTLLKGSMQTFATVVGKDMIGAVRPAVEGLLKGLNRLINAWQGLSSGTKTTIAKVIAIGGAVTAAAGAVMMLAGALPFLMTGLRAVMATVQALRIAFMGALIGPLGLAVAAVGLLYLAYRDNLGGLADWTNQKLDQVKLAWDGLVQLFTEGRLSGAVLGDLNKAENQGIKQFIGFIGAMAARLQDLWSGIKVGAAAAWETMKPGLMAIGEGVEMVWDQLSRLFDLLTSGMGITKGSMNSWADFGDAMMEGVGGALRFVFDLISSGLEIVASFGEGIADAIAYMGNPLADLKDAFMEIWDSLMNLVGAVGGFSESGGTIKDVLIGIAHAAGTLLGGSLKVLTWTLKKVATVIGWVIDLVGFLVKGFIWLGKAVGEGLGWWVVFFTETLPAAFKTAVGFVNDSLVKPLVAGFNAILDGITGVVNSILAFLARSILKVASFADFAVPDSMIGWAEGQLGHGGGGNIGFAAIAERAAGGTGAGIAASAASSTDGLGDMVSGVAGVAPQAQAEASATRRGVQTHDAGGQKMDDFIARFEAAAQAGKTTREIVLEVDGTKIAKLVAEEGMDGAIRNLEQVPVD